MGAMPVGAVTIIIAGVQRYLNFEVDIKKIIALSTLSHLGPMFITLGKGLPLMAFFHAYFKAILFIRGSFTYLSKSLKKSQGRNRKGDYAAF